MGEGSLGWTQRLPDTWRLTLHQSTHGYRFALEAFLLADFVPAPAPAPCIDLGTGCGVVALFLARRFPRLCCVGLELQRSLVVLAQQNVVCNGLEHHIGIVQGDMRQVSSLFPLACSVLWCVILPTVLWAMDA